MEFQNALEAYLQLRESEDPTQLHGFILKLLEDLKYLQEELSATKNALDDETVVQGELHVMLNNIKRILEDYHT
jgi:hypothetical protein